MPRIRPVLAILACLLPAAPAAAVPVPPSAPPDRALALLGPLVRSGKGDPNSVFLYGLAAIGASRQPGLPAERRAALLGEAIRVFHAMLVQKPGLVRVRLELARALFLKGEDRLARRHFEQVLAGKPPAGVALNVNRFLDIMRARKRWSLRLGMAMLPDTNIGAGSDERTVWIDVGGQRLPFRRDAEELTASGVGVSAWLGGEYQLPVGPPGTGSGASEMRLRAGGDIMRREYRGSRFDRLTVSGHVGPRWLIGRGGEVSLLLTGLYAWTGSGLEEPSHHDIGLRAEVLFLGLSDRGSAGLFRVMMVGISRIVGSLPAGGWGTGVSDGRRRVKPLRGSFASLRPFG